MNGNSLCLVIERIGRKEEKYLNIYSSEADIQLTIRARSRAPPQSREWELTPPTSNNTILKPKLDLHFNQTQNSVNLPACPHRLLSSHLVSPACPRPTLVARWWRCSDQWPLSCVPPPVTFYRWQGEHYLASQPRSAVQSVCPGISASSSYKVATVIYTGEVSNGCN